MVAHIIHMPIKKTIKPYHLFIPNQKLSK